jgi:hypothetical protein
LNRNPACSAEYVSSVNAFVDEPDAILPCCADPQAPSVLARIAMQRARLLTLVLSARCWREMRLVEWAVATLDNACYVNQKVVLGLKA